MFATFLAIWHVAILQKPQGQYCLWSFHDTMVRNDAQHGIASVSRKFNDMIGFAPVLIDARIRVNITASHVSTHGFKEHAIALR
jgi:hypothetical protein